MIAKTQNLNVWKKSCWVWSDIDKLSKSPIYIDDNSYIRDAKEGKIKHKFRNLKTLKNFLQKRFKGCQANSSIYFYDETNNTSFDFQCNFSSTKNVLEYKDNALIFNGFVRNPFYKADKFPEVGVFKNQYKVKEFMLLRGFKLFEKQTKEIHYKILDQWDSQVLIYLFDEYLINKFGKRVIPFDCDFIIIHLKN